jgi:L-lactate dehydrogenase complex protein LldG
MKSLRDEMLERIRGAIGKVPQSRDHDYASVPRAYRQTAALGRAECLELFADRLAHYDAGVYHCERADLSSTIARALEARNKRRVVIPAAVPREWLPTQREFVADDGLTHAELDAIDGAVTGCTVAIALTGTIVLGHSPAEGRRALTLIPDYHLCVVETSQIVETVPEAFRRLAALDPRLLTTISGPSATADIEMTRIKGVHGPRTLDVVIVH